MAILLGVLAMPLLTAAAQPGPGGQNGTGSNGKPGNAPTSAYTLMGDATNTGSDFTYFDTSAVANGCDWCFNNTYNVTNTVALGGFTFNGANGIGTRGQGLGTGVQGLNIACCDYPARVVAGVDGYSDTATGVYGRSNSGIGVRATSSSNYAGYFNGGGSIVVYAIPQTSSSSFTVLGTTLIGGSSIGVYGSTDQSYGVYGTAYGNPAGSGAGVYGQNVQYNSAPVIQNAGVYGSCGSCVGVIGISDSYIGVRGTIANPTTVSYAGYFTNTQGIAVYGRSTSNFGLFGASDSSYGVRASSTNSYAVLATSTNSVGVRGTSQSYYGFYAGSTSGTGGYGYTATGLAGIRAHNDTTTAGHYGLISDGDVLVNGNITCTGSCLAAMGVKTSSGEKLVYADSSTQSFISDQGSATLKDGRAVIKIDALFGQTVNLGGSYQVFLTPASFSSAGLAVGNKTATSFEVRELNGGKGNYSFDWRVTAPRKGYEKNRLDSAPTVAPPATEPDVPAFTDPVAANMQQMSPAKPELLKGAKSTAVGVAAPGQK